MADYTSAASVRSMVTDSNMTTDTSYDSMLGVLITSASRMIDKFVGGWDNYFIADSADTIRYFDGNGDKVLYIDPFISITKLEVVESGGVAAADYTEWTENTDYITIPYNRLPKRGLQIERFGNKSNFYRYQKGIKVTGKFGYSAIVPDDIANACRIQVLRWFMRAKSAYQDASASAASGQVMYMKELDPDVKMLLQPYRVESVFL